MGAGMFKLWGMQLAKATWLVNTQRSANRADPAQLKLFHTVERENDPGVHVKNILVMEKASVFKPHVSLTAPNFIQRNTFIRDCV